MLNVRRAAVFVLLITALLLPAHAQQWISVRSTNYTVISDATENETRALALRLEQMRTTYGALFHRQGNLSSPFQTVVFALKNPGGLATVARQYKASATDGVRVYHGLERWFLTGMTLSANGTLADTPQNDAALRDVALMLLEYNYPHTPLWFDTGISEYLGALSVEKENVVMGRVPERLGGGAHFPLDRLLSATSIPAAEEPAFRHKSWLLVHWVLSNSRLGNAGNYFDLTMNQGLTPREASLRAFSVAPDELDKELSSYDPAKEIRTYPLPYVDVGRFLTHKMTPTDLQIAIANMSLDSPGDEDAAMKTLSGIMQQYPNIADVHRALAYGYIRRKDLNNAMEHIHSATHLADTDPLMHYFQAVVLNDGNQDEITVESAEVKLSAPLTNAIKLDPQFARAYELRGIARLDSEKKNAGLTDIKTACALRPRDDHALFSLAKAQETLGQPDAARALYALVSRSSDPALAQKAKDAYANIGREQRQQKKMASDNYPAYRDRTDPRWKVPNAESGDEAKKEAGPDTRKTEYLKGTLVSVDCSDTGSATLRLASNNRAWKLAISDRKNVLLINRDEFSCAWHNVRVGVNYKPSGPQMGDVVSIEVLN